MSEGASSTTGMYLSIEKFGHCLPVISVKYNTKLKDISFKG